jgi:hypothetical protein
MADYHRGKPAETCITARIDALGGQVEGLGGKTP